MFNTLSQTAYYRENGLFPASIESNEYIKRMFGNVKMRPTTRAFRHPHEYRLRSLIRSHRDTIVFLREQLAYDLESAADERYVERVHFIIHCNSESIRHLYRCVYTVRFCVAMGITVPDFVTVR